MRILLLFMTLPVGVALTLMAPARAQVPSAPKIVAPMTVTPSVVVLSSAATGTQLPVNSSLVPTGALRPMSSTEKLAMVRSAGVGATSVGVPLVVKPNSPVALAGPSGSPEAWLGFVAMQQYQTTPSGGWVRGAAGLSQAYVELVKYAPGTRLLLDYQVENCPSLPAFGTMSFDLAVARWKISGATVATQTQTAARGPAHVLVVVTAPVGDRFWVGLGADGCSQCCFTFTGLEITPFQ